MANPIKYSDLVAPDSSITDLIAQLRELAATYKAMATEMKNEATAIRTALQNVNSATKEGADETEKQTKKADELAAAYNRLQKAQADNAAEIARVNQLAKEQNQVFSLMARAHTAQEGSYNQMAARLAQLRLTYQKMTEEQRKDAWGQTIQKEMTQAAAAIKEYDTELREKIKLEQLDAQINQCNGRGNGERCSRQAQDGRSGKSGLSADD